MTDEFNSLDLQATLDRMEPGVSIPAVEQSLASIAISLKRIADIMADEAALSVSYDRAELSRRIMDGAREISQSINSHSNKVMIAR